MRTDLSRRHGHCARILWSAALLVSARAWTGELDRGGVVAALQSWLDGTRDLECRFEQRLVSGALGSGTVESGTLRILRPGRMRWDYSKPEAKIALVRGNETEVYLPADRQLIRGRMDREGNLLGALLTGSGRLDDFFRPLLIATPSRGGDGAYLLRLEPKIAGSGGEEGPGFESVTLFLRPPEFGIAAAEVLDAAGNRVAFRFSAIRRNRGIREGFFQLEPPPGTEIVGGP